MTLNADSEHREKVKILFIIDSLEKGGGTQNILFQLVDGLLELNYIPTVMSLNGGDQESISAFFRKNVDVINLNKTNLLLWGIPYILYHMHTSRYDIVQTFLFYANNLGRILTSMVKITNVVTSIRGFQVDGVQMKKWQIALERFTNRLENIVVINTEKARSFCSDTLGISEERVAVIPNGIEMPEQTPTGSANRKSEFGIDPGRFVIGAVGRLTVEKGHKYLLEAVQRVKKMHSNILLLVVGDGKLRKHLENYAVRLGIGDEVLFAGYRHDVKTIYQMLDLFILPSLIEGMPNVVLEAMSYGLPIVATRVGGVPELIDDGVSGRIVPPKNSDALSEAIQVLINQPEMAQEMGNHARKRAADRFSKSKMVQSYHALYQRLLRTG